MSKINNKKEELEGKETVEFFKDLDKEALNTERFLEKNAKLLSGIFISLVVAVVGYFAYQQFIVAPKNEEALKSFLTAQKKLNEGNNKDALGGTSAANPGFLGTYNNSTSTKIGKLSAYHAGLLKLNEGKFQEAYDLLDKFSTNSDVMKAMKFGAMADAQSGLNKNNEALDLLNKAVSASSDEYTAYYFTKKAGILALGMKKNTEAKQYFNSINDKYKEYDNGMSDAYIEMVKYY